MQCNLICEESPSCAKLFLLCNVKDMWKKINPTITQVCFNSKLSISQDCGREAAARVFTFPQQHPLSPLFRRWASFTSSTKEMQIVFSFRHLPGAGRGYLVAVGKKGNDILCHKTLHCHLHRQHPPLDRLQHHNCAAEKQTQATKKQALSSQFQSLWDNWSWFSGDWRLPLKQLWSCSVKTRSPLFSWHQFSGASSGSGVERKPF